MYVGRYFANLRIRKTGESRKPDLHGSADRISDIGYEYLKLSALRNRKGRACDTKPIVYKHKQKQMQPSLNKHKLMIKRSLIRHSIL